MWKRAIAAAVLVVSAQQAYSLSFGDILNAAGKAQLPSAQSAESNGQTASLPPPASPQDAKPPLSAENQQLMQQGMWEDPATGLTWMRCPVGDDFGSGGCQQNAQTAFNNVAYHGHWWDAVKVVQGLAFGGLQDWRMPTYKELQGIRAQIQPGSLIFPSDAGLSNGMALWTSTPFGELLPGALNWGKIPSTQYAVKQTFWSLSRSVFSERPVQNGNSIPYESEAGILAVRGGSYDEFKAMVIAVDDANAQIAAAQQAADAGDRKFHKQQAAEIAANHAAKEAAQKRDIEFQRSVQVGDNATVFVAGTNQVEVGVVLAINGNLIQVQTYDPPLVLWYQREHIFPGPNWRPQ